MAFLVKMAIEWRVENRVEPITLNSQLLEGGL